MSSDMAVVNEAVLIPLSALIAYYDVRYRRIPNAFVLGTLFSGLAVNTLTYGLDGFLSSAGGGLLGFGFLLILRFCGAMGAGDVKLFGAIGTLIGAPLVPPTFVLIVLIGGLMGIYSMLRQQTVREVILNLARIFTNPRGKGATQPERQTVPYGVAITMGSLLSVSISLVSR